MKDLTLTLRPRFESGAADKAITKQQALLKATQSTFEKINKDANKGLKDQEGLWKRLGAVVETFGRTSVTALGSTLSGINKVQSGFEGVIKKAFSLKNVILGSAVGYGVVRAGAHILGQGAGQVRNMRALTREFGPGLLYESIMGKSKDIGEATGLQSDDVIHGMLPILRAINETRVGDKVGGRQIRTKSQLEAVQRSQFATAANRFKTMATLNPEMSPEQIGFLLAEAGTGEEGMKGLGRALHLGRASMADVMRDAKKNKSGNAEIIDAIFKRAGYTEQAESAERGSFEFQAKAIKSAFDDALGDVGSKAIEKLNEHLGEGTGLAERFSRVLEKNGPVIEKIADGLAGVVDKLLTLAERLPEALSWLDDHKGTLLAIGGVYGGLRVASSLRDTFGKALGGTGSAIAGLVGEGGKGTPVYVTNWGESGGMGGAAGAAGVPGAAGKALSLGQKAGLVGAALATGLTVGTAADQLSGGRLSGGLSRALDSGADRVTEDIGVEQGRQRLAAGTSERLARIALLESKGIEHGEAVYAADNATTAQGLETMKKAGITFNLGGMNVGNISTAVGQNAPAIVKMLMPDLQEQLTRKLRELVPNG